MRLADLFRRVRVLDRLLPDVRLVPLAAADLGGGPSDVLKEGQEVKVKLLGFDDRGKVRLAMKMVDQETGEEIVEEKSNEEE